MVDEKEQQRLIRRRLRKTAVRLYEDTSVRSHLTDEQATRLLNWGEAIVRKTAEQTINLPNEDALPLLEQKVAGVREIMLTINKLLRTFGDTFEPDTRTIQDDWFTQLLKNISWTTGRQAQLRHFSHMGEFKRLQRADGTIEQAFEALMSFLDVGAEAEEEE